MEFTRNVREHGTDREHEIFSGSGRIHENFEILEFIGILERILRYPKELEKVWQHE